MSETDLRHFEDGETVTLVEAVDRHMGAANELVEQLSDVFVDMWKSLAPVMREMAEAMQPVAELGERVESDREDDREDHDR